MLAETAAPNFDPSKIAPYNSSALGPLEDRGGERADYAGRERVFRGNSINSYISVIEKYFQTISFVVKTVCLHVATRKFTLPIGVARERTSACLGVTLTQFPLDRRPIRSVNK